MFSWTLGAGRLGMGFGWVSRVLHGTGASLWGRDSIWGLLWSRGSLMGYYTGQGSPIEFYRWELPYRAELFLRGSAGNWASCTGSHKEQGLPFGAGVLYGLGAPL